MLPIQVGIIKSAPQLTLPSGSGCETLASGRGSGAEPGRRRTSIRHPSRLGSLPAHLHDPAGLALFRTATGCARGCEGFAPMHLDSVTGKGGGIRPVASGTSAPHPAILPSIEPKIVHSQK
ncbi:hypothetical protein AUP68_09024 [Ilyonectria robusta]